MPTPEDFARLRQNMGIPEPEPETDAICPGCDDKPAPQNNPCAVCGKRAPAAAEPGMDFVSWALFHAEPIDPAVAYEAGRRQGEWAANPRPTPAPDTPAVGGAEKARLAKLIHDFYMREIGVLMQQAEHWAANGKPYAVHHRLQKADAYYQIVAHFDPTRRNRGWDEPFADMEAQLARPPVKSLGAYPYSKDLHRFNDPAFVAIAAGKVVTPPPRADAAVGGEDDWHTINEHLNAYPKTEALDAWERYWTACSHALGGKDAEALQRYRAVSHWIGADAWDGCSDCMERLRWASGLDIGREMTSDQIATITSQFRSPPPRADAAADDVATLREAREVIRDLLEAWPDNHIAGAPLYVRAAKHVNALASTQRKEG